MNLTKREGRLKALAERSSYVENVLSHALVAELSSVLWQRDPFTPLQVFNSEVDDSGFDLVLTIGSQARYVQLKQAHDEKIPTHCSVRLSFSNLPGSCVVLMSHSLATLRLTQFRFYGSIPELSSNLVYDRLFKRRPAECSFRCACAAAHAHRQRISPPRRVRRAARIRAIAANSSARPCQAYRPVQ